MTGAMIGRQLVEDLCGDWGSDWGSGLSPMSVCGEFSRCLVSGI